MSDPFWLGLQWLPDDETLAVELGPWVLAVGGWGWWVDVLPNGAEKGDSRNA